MSDENQTNNMIRIKKRIVDLILTCVFLTRISVVWSGHKHGPEFGIYLIPIALICTEFCILDWGHLDDMSQEQTEEYFSGF